MFHLICNFFLFPLVQGNVVLCTESNTSILIKLQSSSARTDVTTTQLTLSSPPATPYAINRLQLCLGYQQIQSLTAVQGLHPCRAVILGPKTSYPLPQSVDCYFFSKCLRQRPLNSVLMKPVLPT